MAYFSNEEIDFKIDEYEKTPMKTYFEAYSLDSNDERYIKRFSLYHGLRDDYLAKLESIFQSKFILCGKKVPTHFISYDGTEKRISIDYNDIDNCNQGDYISVMPYEPGDDNFSELLFNAFIKERLFLVLKGNLPAMQTFYLDYSQYCRIVRQREEKQLKKLYSYGLGEYMVKDAISIDNILAVGINSRFFVGDYDSTVEQVINLLKHYEINIPFLDFYSGDVLCDLRYHRKK